MQRRVHFDNPAEYHHWLLLEGTPGVVQFCEQYPQAKVDGRYHVFDMWIRWQDGREECREVLPSGRLMQSYGGKSIPPYWSILDGWSRAHGYTCSFVTDTDLDLHAQCIQNWQRLLPFVQLAEERADTALETAVLEQLAGKGGMRLGELTQILFRTDEMLVTATVANLLHQGRLTADLEHARFGAELLLRP